MPEIIPGYDTQQKTVTVANNDTDINAEITTQAEDGWIAGQMIISDTNMVILFTRNVLIPAESP